MIAISCARCASARRRVLPHARGRAAGRQRAAAAFDRAWPGDKIWGEVSNNDTQTDDAFVADKQLLISLAKRGELPAKKPALNVRGEANLDNGLQLVFPAMSDEQIDQELPCRSADPAGLSPPAKCRASAHAASSGRDHMRGGRVLLVP